MIFIGRILTEETKKKRRIVFYNKAIDKAKSEIGKKYNRLTITDIDYENHMIVTLIRNIIEYMLELNATVAKYHHQIN